MFMSDAAFLLGDGRHLGYRAVGAHWILGRQLLDAIRPTSAEDPMARQWYVAAAAYMESVRHFEDAIPHLNRARDLFPDDAAILFYTGAIHEHYASPGIQSAIRSIKPTIEGAGGLMIVMKPTVLSPEVELSLAESFYRRSLSASPSAEIQLRLGRVIGLLGRHRDAIAMLTLAKAGLRDPALRYDACLFLGREQHQVKALDAARAEFREAAKLFPLAQSVHLALSQIAGEVGDRAASLDEIRSVLVQLPNADDDRDPWTNYMFSHLRNMSALFLALYDVIPPASGS